MKAFRQLRLFKSCIYCGRKANSKEHVPSKTLLEQPYPLNLWSVPSCTKCNNSFSKDEEYFLIAIAHASTAESLLRRVDEGGSVDRALTRSARLDANITHSLQPSEDGRVYLAADIERCKRVVKKISDGLYFKCFDQVPPEPRLLGVHHVERLPQQLRALTVRGGMPALLWPEAGSRRLMRMLRDFPPPAPPSKRWDVIQPSVFEFMFANSYQSPRLSLCITKFHNTVWGVVGYPQIPAKVLRTRRSRMPTSAFGMAS